MLLRRFTRFVAWALAGGLVLWQAVIGEMADGSFFAIILAALLGLALIIVGIASALGLDQTPAEEQA